MKLVFRALLFSLLPQLLSAQTADSLREAYIDNREIESTWNMDFLQEDIASEVTKPMKFGAFPTPDYNSKDPGYNGLENRMYPGVQGYYKDIKGQRVLYNSISIGKNNWNAEKLGDRNTEVFFHIIVLTDSVDTNTYRHFGNQILSRNHPDYVMQGFFETKVGSVEYIAFQTASMDAFALVNMRLFDLKKGKTILIAPHKDGSYRSMQILSPPLSSDQVDTYTDTLLSDPKVVDFFTEDGVIRWED